MSQSSSRNHLVKPADDAAAETKVLSSAPKDEGERSNIVERPKKGFDKAGRVEDLFQLLENSENDETGSKNLGVNLPTQSDPEDAQNLHDLVNSPRRNSKTTLLHLAAEKGFSSMASQLINAGADINAQDDEKSQPLHLACRDEKEEMVKLLLKGEYTPKADDSGRYPLHLACMGRGFNSGTLRLIRDAHTSVINEKEAGMGMTPLNMAVCFGRQDVVSILLETDVETDVKIDIEDDDGWTPLITAAYEHEYGIFNELVGHLEQFPNEVALNKQDDNGMTALMILCAHRFEGEYFEVIQKSICDFLKLEPNVNLSDHYGQTVLHHLMSSNSDARARSTESQELLKKILDLVSVETPFLHDKGGHSAFDSLFDDKGLKQDQKPFTDILVDCYSDDKTPKLFSWLALRKERHAYADKLVANLSNEGQTGALHQLKPNGLGEWAIYNQQPGCLLDYVTAISQHERDGDHTVSPSIREKLKGLIKSLKENVQTKEDQTPTGWNEKGKKRGDRMNQTDATSKNPQEDSLRDMEDIIDLFCVGKAMTSEEKRALEVPTQNLSELLKHFHAAVIQMRQGEKEVGIFAKYRNLNNIIYGDGSLATVREIIERSRKDGSTTEGNTRSISQGESEPGEEFTWIHLPSTNMTWMHDMLKRVLNKSDYGDDDFQNLASFFRASWVEIPDTTTHSRFMRPRYTENQPAKPHHKRAANRQIVEEEESTGIPVDQDQRREDSTSESETIEDSQNGRLNCSALYMPYLSFSTYQEDMRIPREPRTRDLRAKESGRHRHELFDAYKEEPIHGSPTLDEYYYHFDSHANRESDQGWRNKTQVVTKHLFGEISDTSKPWTLLTVNQLWAWTIGKDWLITASSCASTDPKTKFVDDILTHLGKQVKGGNGWRGPVSPADLRNVIVEYCIGIYERKYKQKELGLTEDGDRQRSIRQIFSDSINETRRVETDLFKHFCEGRLGKERQQDGNAQQQLADLKSHTIRAALQLFQIKDIRDELNILKTIARSQQKVQSAIAANKAELTCHDCHTCHSPGPDINAQYVLSDMDELDTAAEQAQEALHTTITLQESQTSNLQAEESASQGRILFVFTLITTVFVPLSFFSSLFALDVNSFLQAPTWSLIVIFTAPLPFMAGAYVLSKKSEPSKPASTPTGKEPDILDTKAAGKESPSKHSWGGSQDVGMRRRFRFGGVKGYDPEAVMNAIRMAG